MIDYVKSTHDRTPWYRDKVFDRPGNYWFKVWSQHPPWDSILSPTDQAWQLCSTGQLRDEEVELLMQVALGEAECGGISARVATSMINKWSRTHIAPCC